MSVSYEGFSFAITNTPKVIQVYSSEGHQS